MLTELYRDESTQPALLDEVEPLLFGYARSLLPTAPESFERAVAVTHALVLGFHLRALDGALDIPDVNALRGAAHKMVVRKLQAPDETLLPPAEGSLVPRALELGRRVDAADRALVAGKLLGEDPPGEWEPVRARMVAKGVLR